MTNDISELSHLLEAVRKGVDEAKAGRFQEAEQILKQLRRSTGDGLT
jgi:hypothetical protein